MKVWEIGFEYQYEGDAPDEWTQEKQRVLAGDDSSVAVGNLRTSILNSTVTIQPEGTDEPEKTLNVIAFRVVSLNCIANVDLVCVETLIEEGVITGGDEPELGEHTA